jgi:hypothetical protein
MQHTITIPPTDLGGRSARAEQILTLHIYTYILTTLQLNAIVYLLTPSKTGPQREGGREGRKDERKTEKKKDRQTDIKKKKG